MTRLPPKPLTARLAVAAAACCLSLTTFTSSPAQQEPAGSPPPSTPTSDNEARSNAATSSPEEAKRLAQVEAGMRQRRREQLIRWYGTHPDRPVESAAASEDEWRAVAKLMTEHSPNWWTRFERLPENGLVRERMKRTIVERHRELTKIEQRDPQQYQREVRQLELEDEIYGIGRDIWQSAGSGKAEELKSNLRRKIGELFDVRMSAREERMNRLADTLAKERSKLEADKRGKDAVVQKRFEAVLSRPPEGGGLLGPPPGGKPALSGARERRGPDGEDRRRPVETPASTVPASPAR